MKDYLAQIEKLRKDAAECALIRDLATDPAKRDVFDRLASHLTVLADQVEMAMLERKTGTAPSLARPTPKSRETSPPKRVGFNNTGGSGMFEINGFDTAGIVSLKRLSLAAALKKAKELVADGCWDVQVVDPSGRIYTSFEEQAA